MGQLVERILGVRVSSLLVQGGSTLENCTVRDSWDLTTLLRWLGSVDDREPVFKNDRPTAADCYNLLCSARYGANQFSRQTVRQKRTVDCHTAQDVLYSAAMSQRPSSIAG
jgi:hypothetical protein